MTALTTAAVPTAAPGLTAPASAAPAPGAAAAAATWDTGRAAAAYAADPTAVTASGSENADTAPARAFHGNGTTRRSSDFADNTWIRVDLGSTIRVHRVVLDREAVRRKRYVLEASRNGRDWTPFHTETAGTDGSVTVHTYPQEATARHVRMRGMERATPWGHSPLGPPAVERGPHRGRGSAGGGGLGASGAEGERPRRPRARRGHLPATCRRVTRNH
ncbi:discoidin domain-containing protein [Streptomyces viridosporus T7A]|uniref:Discoidin domain-containing protein n=1 Tax=Streptomyces viridosporus T7A TaxID=665577 RepID=A0ABX6ANC7_STRVD|nr:discoidin domain-containing protein [Streptomyces viridosporus T7A]